MPRSRLALSLLGLFALTSAVALAATGRTTLRNTHSFALSGGTTRTLRAGYPDALKYGRSKYSGTVRLSQPPSGSRGGGPSLHEVHILSRGSCEGGSEFCVRVRNSNPHGNAAVNVRITARTELPPGKRR
jgi:hypothetical protein